MQPQVRPVLLQRRGRSEGPRSPIAVADGQGFNLGQVAVADLDDDAPDYARLSVARY